MTLKLFPVVSPGWRRNLVAVAVFGLVGYVGVSLTGFGSAATYVANAEAEAGTATGDTKPSDDMVGASGSAAVRFGSSFDTPAFSQTVIVSGKDHIWDVLQLPSNDLLFNERSGRISLYRAGQIITVADVGDIKALNLGGLMGMAVDPQFSTNNYVYACLNTTAQDIRVVRWQLLNDSLADRKDIIPDIPAYYKNSHSGCQIGFGADGNLWVGTGDAYTAGNAQSPTLLAGKILRVTRDGQGVAGNMGAGFDPRIFNYGHRNVQGLAMFDQPKNGVYGLSVEHGDDEDDEVNELRNGNFGWAPTETPYREDNVSMTDLARFPNAVLPIWTSGAPTQAPSGASIIYGTQWKGWQGAVAIGMLKDQHLKILHLDDRNRVVYEEKFFQGTYGRIRTATQGNDGSIYLATDNGSNTDKIIKLTPN